jgi:hypothetical protein
MPPEAKLVSWLRKLRARIDEWRLASQREHDAPDRAGR